MKVAHIVGSADTRIGGSLQVARELVAKQVERRVDARLVYLYGAANPAADPSRAPSTALDIDRSRRYTKGMPALRRALRAYGPDIIHHHDGLLWPRLVTPGLAVPLVTHAHSEAPGTWVGRMTQRLALRGTRRMLAVSQWTADGWIEAGFPRDAIEVVANGVDTGRFSRRSVDARRSKMSALGLEPQARILLWAGRLERARKGLDRLVAVVNALPSGWACLIAGDGTDRDWLAARLRAACDAARFRMLGNVTDPEEWFGISDAYLFTSTAEPFGLVVLEAAASELPIVAFECEGGAKPLLGRLDARMVDGYDAAALQDVLRGIARNGLDPAARRIVEESYSWDSIADRTIEIYCELMDAKR